jgi:hypothetical protein
VAAFSRTGIIDSRLYVLAPPDFFLRLHWHDPPEDPLEDVEEGEGLE